MNKREFLLAMGAAMLTPVAGRAYQTATDCEVVPDRAFQPGTVNRPPDCVLDFRLPDDIVQAITRQAGDPTGLVGSYDWTFRLITFDQAGRPRWQEAHRVENSPVRRQGVYFGTIGATYITCWEFTGWLATDPIRSCGQPHLRRVDWPFDWRQLEAMTS